MRHRYLLALVGALALSLGACQSDSPTGHPEAAPEAAHEKAVIVGKFIVVLNDAVAPADVARIAGDLAKRHGGTVKHVYRKAFRGFAIDIPTFGAAAIAGDQRVKRIDQDVMVSARPTPGKLIGRNKAQETSYGVRRVGGSRNATGLRAWIVDSGIDLDHPDLRVGVSLGATFVAGTTNADDQNGHGTHVAGILGAVDNTIGSIGVAAGATVIPVRVLDRKGDGEASAVLAGIEYVIANARLGDVVNMSFGAGLVPAIDDAVLRLAESGVKVVVAAGNDAANCSFISPARVNHPNVYTVSAIDESDRFASFSNYGFPVDLAAPGVEILSSRIGGGVTSMSGTSMAAPHVAGLLLLGAIRTDGRTATGDVDGQPDQIAIW